MLNGGKLFSDEEGHVVHVLQFSLAIEKLEQFDSPVHIQGELKIASDPKSMQVEFLQFWWRCWEIART